MSPETIGQISALIVTLSAIPYAIRVYQRKIKANAVSWSIWSLIGLALLITFRDSGAGSNLWPAISGFVCPVVITGLALWRGERRKPEPLEIVCAGIGVCAIGLWWLLSQKPHLMQFALYVAILADACAAVPTFLWLRKNPTEDRPFAWSFFAVGYSISMFAITEHTFANYALPVWMFCGGLAIATPLIKHRIRCGIPIKEWI